MAVGSRIEDTDYNAIRAKIVNIMGPGLGQFGYGQSIVSENVAQGSIITKDQWDALRFDILNARVHQDGLQPQIVEAVRGQPVLFRTTQPNSEYGSQSDVASANKFNIGAGQFVIDSAGTAVRTTPWSSAISNTVTITFGNADQARWFFNSGGKIRFTSSRLNGSSTAQNSSWSSLLSATGTKDFASVNFYNSTLAPQVLFFNDSSGAYSQNRYTATHRCNIANNTTGGATIITVELFYIDGYVDFNPSPPPDEVNGTLSLVVEELRASGILLPAGTPPFVISRPSYTVTPISGS